MKIEDAEEFTQSLGQIVGGSYRQVMLAKSMGVPKALGLTVEDWVNKRLGGYVRMTVDDRRKAVNELAAEGESNRGIAGALGVDEITVRRDIATNVAHEGDSSTVNAAHDATNVAVEDNTTKQSAGKPEAKIAPPRRTPQAPEGEFSVILADPPWRYDFAETGSRQIENQYPTMDIEEICNLGETMPFAENAVLFLWATAPKLLEALRVLKAWQFSYVTHAIWDKEIIGMGYWFRGQHELLLVAKRGEFPPPGETQRVPSVIHGRRARHSEKPEAAYRMIESAYPDLTESARLELFARDQRAGWTCWGNEVQ